VRDFSGILGLVRLFHSKIIEKKYVNNIELLFGIGEHSSSWFSRLGYDSKVIIKSCYYIDSTPLNKRIQQQGSKIRIIYLGRYVKSKGVINLLQSLIKFNKTIIDNIQIDFYGSGEEFNNMIKFKSSAISESINVYNELNYTETLSKISDYDYLILPSINYSDGWGVVVSEALSIGVPVIVSKFAGASTMVNDMNGFIYDPKNQISLLRILEFIINNSIKYDSNKIKCNFDDHYSSKAGAMKIHKLLTYK
jgi:glycosyltransferase involved in cell wall biosynthesis